MLANNQTLVVSAIHGLGSVGKSTSAAALAHDRDIQNHFSDGILWATLGQEPNVLQRLTDWVHGLGDYNYPVTDMHSTSLHLRTLLTDKAMLLVVDDAWIDKNNGWEYVKAFNVGGSRCCMLVTTRDASIGNVLGANTYSLDVMTETQALELLAQKLKTLGKQLETGEIQSAKALAKAVGYLPLALELAAVQVANGTTWQVLIADIQQEIARLKSLQDPGIRNLGDDEKFKKLSLQASLNLSIKRLEEYDRECFAWLGVLPEDANIIHLMTATLWGTDDRDAMEILQYFQSQALLLPGVTLADGTITYRLHDLFHDLARNLLTASPQPKRQGDLLGLGINWKDAHVQLLDKYQQQTADNYWHTLPDDGYIHQYLVWHLEKAGKIAEIHQLLREESASGHNGWYEVQEKLGQVAGFLTDVGRAWELTEGDFQKDRSRAISLQCRYGLIVSSLNSFSANIPEKLLVGLVKNGYWKPEQGLAYALQKQDLADKANSLIALADYLPENLEKQALLTALETARQIQNELFRARTFSSLAKKLKSKNLYLEALKTAPQIPNEKYRAKFISSLAKELPKDLYLEALETARQIPNEYCRAYALSYFAENLPENLYCEVLKKARQIPNKKYRAQALSSLSDNLQFANLHSADLYSEALETARQIQDKYSRAIALLSLGKKSRSEDLYLEALETARYIQNECLCTQILFSLAERLNSEDLYLEALETARHIQDKSFRAEFISSLAEKLQLKKLYLEALETVRSIYDEYSPTYALSSLSQKLQSENLPSEALEIARQIQDKSVRVNILLSLAEEFQPKNLHLEALDTARQIQDEYSRACALSSLAEKSQSEDLYLEALEVACQIQTGQIQNEKYRADFLSSLVKKDLSENLYREVLKIARQIQDESARTQLLFSLAEKLPSENLYPEVLKIASRVQDEYFRACFLSSLAEKLPSKILYPEVLEIARQIQDECFRVNALSSLAKKLHSENLYLEALEIARQIHNQSSRAMALSFLAEKIPEILYPEVLKTARQIQDEYSRAIALSSLAEKTPENLYPEILEAARQIQFEWDRAEVISSLVEKMPENLYSEALEIAGYIHDECSRAKVLSPLFKQMSASQPKNETYKMWLKIMKTTLSKLKRQEFQRNIAVLTPVIYKLGGKDAIMEIVIAIQDVARWWP